jgi:hypothetical protein
MISMDEHCFQLLIVILHFMFCVAIVYFAKINIAKRDVESMPKLAAMYKLHDGYKYFLKRRCMIKAADFF